MLLDCCCCLTESVSRIQTQDRCLVLCFRSLLFRIRLFFHCVDRLYPCRRQVCFNSYMLGGKEKKSKLESSEIPWLLIIRNKLICKNLSVIFLLRERAFSHCWFLLQMPPRAESGPNQRQEPGTRSLSPTWVAGTEALEPTALTFLECALFGELTWKQNSMQGTLQRI